jgi:PAS domain S-box-containing protein
MRTRGQDASATAGTSRVLLAFDDDRGRALMREWFAGMPGYEVAVAAEPADVPAEFDICVCDEEAVRRLLPVLEERQRAADPIFLPCVLLVTDRSAHSRAEVRRAVETETDLEIHETATLPVDQAEFRRRLENLLRGREASLRLADRKQQYRELVRLAPDGILLVRDDRIAYANEAAADLFGRESAGAVVGAPLSEHIYQDDTAIQAALDAVDTEGSTDSYAEGRVETLDGTVREVEVAGVEIRFEGEPTTQLVLRDVTERKEREEQLTLFERAIETAVQGVTIADARQDDMPLIYLNEAFEEITGYTVPECLGENCRFLQGEGTDEETVAEIRRALDEETPVSVEILNYRKDGTPFWNQLDIVPVRDESGTVTHYLGLQQDVTGRIEREQRLSVLDRVLRHNVRNRGNVIRARAEQIRRGEVDSPAEVAGDIVDSVDELVSITDQVRAFRSVISGEHDELVEHDVVDLLERVRDGLRAESGGSGPTVEIDAPEGVRISAHPMLPFGLGELLRQVHGESARVTVRVRVQEETVTIGFVVGAGAISRAEKEVIRQVRETPVEHSQGLEMWLIRWIVAASGGDLFLEDDDGLAICMRLQTPG